MTRQREILVCEENLWKEFVLWKEVQQLETEY